MAKHWIQPMVAKMKQKGTEGSFGKATEKNIAAGKAAGGKMAMKANAAEQFKKMAAKRKGK